MTYTAEVSSVNQRTQLGIEVTPGTAVAANKRINSMDWTIGINPTVSAYRASGTKYDITQEEDTEETSVTVAGLLDYNAITYILSSVYGLITPALHSPSTTAYDWISTPAVSGSVQPQTYSIEHGDAVRARKFNYCLFNEWGYKGTRKTPMTISAKGFAQPLTDGITMTASPTDIVIAQAVEKQFDIYLDSTSAGLGTTLLTRVLSIEFAQSGLHAPFFAFNRATVGYTAHVDTAPKTSFKLLLEADANGMAPLSYLQAGTTYYLRVQAQGAEIDTPNTLYNTFQHDMAIKFGKPAEFKDDEGIYALEWECNVVQDPTWNSGTAQQLTVTNLSATL